MFYSRAYNATWGHIVKQLNSLRAFNNKPPVTKDAVRAQFKRTEKRLKEKGKWINESNIKR